MTHYPETPWNLTPRQQEAMAAYIEAGTVKLAAEAMQANENTVAELLRQARVRMDAVSLTMAALMLDRLKRAKEVTKEPPKEEWIGARVTKQQAERLRSLGGSQFLRSVIDAADNKPARIENFWGRG